MCLYRFTVLRVTTIQVNHVHPNPSLRSAIWLVRAPSPVPSFVSLTGRLDKKHRRNLSASAFEYKSEIFTALQASVTDGRTIIWFYCHRFFGGVFQTDSLCFPRRHQLSSYYPANDCLSIASLRHFPPVLSCPPHLDIFTALFHYQRKIMLKR